jgi:hypothetical protein
MLSKYIYGLKKLKQERKNIKYYTALSGGASQFSTPPHLGLESTTMSRTQTAVYMPLTNTSTANYRTFANEAEYKTWLDEFSAQNSDGQAKLVDFRVRHLHVTACLSVYLTSNLDIHSYKSPEISMHAQSKRTPLPSPL